MSPPRHPPLGLGAAEAHDQHDLDHALPASGPGNGCLNAGPGSSTGSGPGDAGERVGFLVLAGELSGAGASWTRWRLGPAEVRPGTGAGLGARFTGLGPADVRPGRWAQVRGPGTDEIQIDGPAGAVR